MRLRKGNDSNSAHGQFKKMIAKFSSQCRCGKRIVPGDHIEFDTLLNRTTCQGCSFSRFERAHVIGAELGECDQMIDRFRQLRGLPTPVKDSVISEMHAVFEKLILDFPKSRAVRSLVQSVAKCREKDESALVGICLTYDGYCCHCSSKVCQNSAALYHGSNKTIHCLKCDIGCG